MRSILWRFVRVALAVAHSVGVLITAVQFVGYWWYISSPGPHDPDSPLGAFASAVALGFLGLPWSAGVYVAYADSRPAGAAVAAAHPWLPWLLLVLAVAVNNGLLWWWAVRRPALRRGSSRLDYSTRT